MRHLTNIRSSVSGWNNKEGRAGEKSPATYKIGGRKMETKKWNVTYMSTYGFHVTITGVEALNSTSAGEKVQRTAKDWKRRIKVEQA